MLRHHRFQWRFGPLVFALLSLAGPVRQIVPRSPITGQRIGHPLYILLHVVYAVALPCYVYGGLYPLALYFLCNAFFASCYAYLFQVSHNQHALSHFKYGSAQSERIMGDYDAWLRQQIEASMTYHSATSSESPSPLGRAWSYCFTLCLGGINAQLEHHIAPAVYPIYYYFAAAEVEAFCERHAIRYTKTGGFVDAMLRFHGYMRHIAKDALSNEKNR